MEKKIKIQIKNRWTGCVLFEYEKTNNTIKQTVLEATRQKVNLRGADLRGANLRGADLCDADLCGADLRGADLRDADLCGANLCGADLCGANLCGADLCGADLCDADLCGCVLDYDDCKEGYEGLDELKANVENNSNLKLTKLYENHDAFSSQWGMFWRNMIIIREWEVVTKKTVKVELSEEQKSLIKLFAKMHQANALEYKLYTDGGMVYSGFVIDDEPNDSKLLDLPDTIKGLEENKTYTLAELGIEL